MAVRRVFRTAASCPARRSIRGGAGTSRRASSPNPRLSCATDTHPTSSVKEPHSGEDGSAHGARWSSGLRTTDISYHLVMTRGSLRVVAAVVVTLAARAMPVLAQDFPRGTVIDDVKCAADPTQRYALYLPSTYSRDRLWNLLIAFHPAARGRAMVEKYQAAAEQYGYIVAGSNTSRNGPMAVSAASVRAMSADLGQRFSIAADRVYLTGMSGGARVALQVALGRNNIAGVIASSAGYPDSKPRSSVPFAVFSTAGTDDFNYIEMRQLDRKLTSPHYLAVFNGGHTLPPDAVALEAIEWLELQSMKPGRRSRDDALIDRLFEKRQRLLAASTSPAGTVHLLDALAA